MKKVKKTEKLIHIHAESVVLSVDEIVLESKCVQRLCEIREVFVMAGRHHIGNFNLLKFQVRTRVINPELPFV